MDYFSERLLEVQRRKRSIAMLGVDPQLDAPGRPGLPKGYTLAHFCCAIVEACADSVCAIKPQLAFFEARGMDGMRALAEVIALARRLGLLTIADAKRGDIGSTSAAYAEAFLGDGDFGCDAVTVNPYLGSDAIAPFVTPRARRPRPVRAGQDFQSVLGRVPGSRGRRRAGMGMGGASGSKDGAAISSVRAGSARSARWSARLIREHAARARELMPHATVLVPGYGAQGASAADAVRAARADGTGVVVNASREPDVRVSEAVRLRAWTSGGRSGRGDEGGTQRRPRRARRLSGVVRQDFNENRE